MFIPFKAEVEVLVSPVANWLLIGLTLFVFVAVELGMGAVEVFVLDGFNASLLFHGFMHGGWLHIFGNMFYLWVFGNAVCSRIGNATFPSIYFALIVLSGSIHLLIDGSPAIGASGAVNGVVGLYLFLYPNSTIRCVWTAGWARGKRFNMRIWWLVGLWFAKDLYGAIHSEAPIAYVAHLGGLYAGLMSGWLLFRLDWIKRRVKEPNLLQLWIRG